MKFALLIAPRPTSGNANYKGSTKRRLYGRYWYPAIDGDYIAPGVHPLVVYSHGYSANHGGGEYIGRDLASRGYIVVAVDFPLTKGDAEGGPVLHDVVNQPADVSFVIDEMLRMAADTGSHLFNRVDIDRVGLVGSSLGGTTSMLAALHPRLSDSRVQVMVSLAGPSTMFLPAFFSASNVPFMVVAASNDVVVPYTENAAALLNKVAGPFWLVTIKGGSHVGFSSASEFLRWLPNPDVVSCFIVVRNLTAQPIDESLMSQLGGIDDGLQAVPSDINCPEQLPAAINPLRQHQLTLLALASFLEMHFADTKIEREAAQAYLRAGYMSENPRVKVHTAEVNNG